MLLGQVCFSEEKTFLGQGKAFVPWPGSNRADAGVRSQWCPVCSPAHCKQHVTEEDERDPQLCDTGSWHWEFKEEKGQSSQGRFHQVGPCRKVDLSVSAVGRREGRQFPKPAATIPSDLFQGTGLGLADRAFMCVRSRSSRSPWRCS